MKHIGIVGVTASGSALCYNEIIAEAAKNSGFPVKHPEVSINNISFSDYYNAGPTTGSAGWAQVHDIVLTSINKLKGIGADFVIIPANTVHCEFENLKSKSSLPIRSIVDATLDVCEQEKIKKVVVLGTKHVINSGLYKQEIGSYGMEYCIPDPHILDLLQSVINSLISGQSQNQCEINEIIYFLKNADCDAVILACTELPLILTEQLLGIQVINTTKILAKKALEFAISK